MSNGTTRSCFGMFLGADECKQCAASKLCKSVLVSNGFDLVGSMVSELVATLSDGIYSTPQGEAEIVQLLLKGSPVVQASSEEVAEHG